jgi:hypothetical protein
VSARAAAWLAWFLWALYVALAIPLVLLGTVNEVAGTSADPVSSLLQTLLYDALVVLVMMTVGALVASRQPRNAIGWLFCCVALASESGALGIEYAVYALKTRPGSLPAGVWAGLYGNLARGVGWYLLLTFLLLLFPNGRLPTPRWRRVAWFSGVSLALYSIVSLLVPDAFANTDSRLADVRNPLAITQHPAVMGPLEGLSILLIFGATVACGASIVVRFRRARGVERQQLKWFAYTVVCGLVLFAAIIVTMFLPGSPGVLGYGFDLVLIALPLATGIAILRYRLFDIDLIIRRTLIYGSLTAVLAGVYFAVVLVAQVLGDRLTGQTQPPPWLIVMTTLVIAALFNPLRGRIQATIDRRFYRSKYDAARTLEAFAATLRTETDLSELSAQLVGVVDETMRPAHISLWLRAPANRREDGAQRHERRLEGGQA